METLTGFKRAGCDLILTYHAKDAARWPAKLDSLDLRLEIKELTPQHNLRLLWWSQYLSR